MAAYYTSQSYDAPSTFIWNVLTDFPSWPAWFPRMGSMKVLDGGVPADGVELLATDENGAEWTRWLIARWSEPNLLVCEYVESNVSISRGVQAAYLQFELVDDADGCTLEVELGAEGAGIVGDFVVGMTLGTGARRMLPQLVDAFSDHVVRRASAT
ncbi:MAG TPA: SRPBCC family protein [Dehalococcoidia bacterium]|jgi:hypothetical protein